MPHEQLDGSQIGSCFHQVCGKRVPEGVRSNALLYAGSRGRFFAGIPDGLVGNRRFFTAMAAGAGKEIDLRLFPAPVLSQSVEQLGRHRHVSISRAFALVDMNDHSRYRCHLL